MKRRHGEGERAFAGGDVPPAGLHLPFPAAALCERLPNMDVTMTRGWPEDVPPEVDQLAHAVTLLDGRVPEAL